MANVATKFDIPNTSSQPQSGLGVQNLVFVNDERESAIQILLESSEGTGMSLVSWWETWIAATLGAGSYTANSDLAVSSVCQFAQADRISNQTSYSGTSMVFLASALRSLKGKYSDHKGAFNPFVTVMNFWDEGLRASSTSDLAEAADNVGGWMTEAERIVRELGRLERGWAGADAEPPLPEAINDVEAVARMLPPDTTTPNVEVDDGDGYISLRWRRSDDNGSFALVFNGKHQVIGTLSPTHDYIPWKLSVSDELEILIKFDHEDVLATVTNR
jgi:hypothetical protein